MISEINLDQNSQAETGRLHLRPLHPLPAMAPLLLLITSLDGLDPRSLPWVPSTCACSPHLQSLLHCSLPPDIGLLIRGRLPVSLWGAAPRIMANTEIYFKLPDTTALCTQFGIGSKQAWVDLWSKLEGTLPNPSGVILMKNVSKNDIDYFAPLALRFSFFW